MSEPKPQWPCGRSTSTLSKQWHFTRWAPLSSLATAQYLKRIPVLRVDCCREYCTISSTSSFTTSTPCRVPFRIDGQTIALRIEEQVRAGVKQLQRTRAVTPRLLIIVCADARDDTLVYVSKKKEACQRVGIACDIVSVPQHCTTREWIHFIQQQQSAYEALIVQWPINAPHVSWTDVVQSIDPQRDVDCLTVVNHGKLAFDLSIEELPSRSEVRQQQQQSGFLPCVVDAVKECLEWTYAQLHAHRIPHRPLTHSNVVLLGRSLLVGRPLATYLLSVSGSVSMVHKDTPESMKYELLREADVIVSATGQMHVIDPHVHPIKSGVVLIDVGFTRVVRASSLANGGVDIVAGDIHPRAYSLSTAYTPVPGGIGPVTVACLLRNVLKAATTLHQ